MNPSTPVVNLEENEVRETSQSGSGSSSSNPVPNPVSVPVSVPVLNPVINPIPNPVINPVLNLVPEYDSDDESGSDSDEEIDPEVVWQINPWPADPVVDVVEIHLSDESPSNSSGSASMELDSGSESPSEQAEISHGQALARPHHDIHSSGSASMVMDSDSSTQQAEIILGPAPSSLHRDIDSDGSASMVMDSDSSTQQAEIILGPALIPPHRDIDSSGSASMDLCSGSSDEAESVSGQAPAPLHPDANTSGSASMDIPGGSSVQVANGVSQAPAQMQNHVGYYPSSRDVSMDISSGSSPVWNGVNQPPAHMENDVGHLTSSRSVSMGLSAVSSEEAENILEQAMAQLQDHVSSSGSASMDIFDGSSEQTQTTAGQPLNRPEVTDLYEQFPFQQGNALVPAPLSIRRASSSDPQARDTDREQPPTQHGQEPANPHAAEGGVLGAEVPAQTGHTHANLPRPEDLHTQFPFQQGLMFVPRPLLIRRALAVRRQQTSAQHSQVQAVSQAAAAGVHDEEVNRARVVGSAPSDPLELDHSELTGQNTTDLQEGSEVAETRQYDADDELSDETKSEVDLPEDALRQTTMTYMTGAYTSLYDYSTGSDGCDEREQNVQHEDSEQADLSCALENSQEPETVVSAHPPTPVSSVVDAPRPEELAADENGSFDDELRVLDEWERERDVREARANLGELAWYYESELPLAPPPVIRVIPPETEHDYSNLLPPYYDPELLYSEE